MLIDAISKQASSSTTYDVSEDRKIDEKLDVFARMTLAGCNEDLNLYVNQHSVMLDELEGMNLQPHQWQLAMFRHGLPNHLREATFLHFLPFHKSDHLTMAQFADTQHRNALINDLQAAQTRSTEVGIPLETPGDEMDAAPGQISEREEDDDSMPSRSASIQVDDDEPVAAEAFEVDDVEPVAAEAFEVEVSEPAAAEAFEIEVSEPAAEVPAIATKRRRSNQTEEDDDDPSSSGDITTSTQAQPTTTPRRTRKRAKRATAEERVSRANIRRLAEPVNPNSVSVKTEPSSNDVKGSRLYFLGPRMFAHRVFSYLFYFATNLPAPGPLAMNVASLPKQKMMARILSDTMKNYARSRTSQSLTEAGVGSLSDEQALKPVDLDQNLLKEPTSITQARDLQESLAIVSGLWKHKHSIGVHQKLLESWAIAIVYNAVGIPVGQDPPRPKQGEIKRAAQALMPVLKPQHMQGISNQTIIRTQYYWKLLAEFRTVGLPFIVAYRTSTVDTALLADGGNRLRGEDIPAWVPLIKAIESHLTDWFDALEGGKGRSDSEQMRKSLTTPCTWESPWDQSMWNSLRQTPSVPKHVYPESTLGLHKHGYNGWLAKRKSWSVMEVVGTGQSMAVADIPEASFLGVVPGVLRCSVSFVKGCIPGPDGIWLDTRDSKGSLAKIALGAKQETNTVLAWHIAGDCGAPAFQTAFVLAFSCRPIEIFQELVRWDGGVSQIKEEDEG